MYKKRLKVNLEANELKSLDKLFKLFIVHGGYELYLVGGCVRDFLLGRQPKDVDLCTNATPEQVKSLLDSAMSLKAWDSGIKHGTLTVVDSFLGTSYEITTFRIDGEYLDNRRPDSVEFTSSLEEDLKRRDLTINSFAYNLPTEELIMLDETFMQDLELGLVRCVGDADERFNEDALRMLRAIRFAAQLGYSIEVNTFAAIKRNVDLIKNISAERVRDELTKIICSDNPQMLELLIMTGLHRHIMPELEEMLACKQINVHHYTDVLHHTFDVIKGIPKNKASLRWSALFHDMGKPDSLMVDLAGQQHFYGHALTSADKVRKYACNLKFDTATFDYIYNMVKFHDRDLVDVKKRTLKGLITLVNKELFSDYLMLRQADAASHSLPTAAALLGAVAETKDKYLEVLRYKEPMSTKDLVIDGYDVMNLGFKGKEVGLAIQACVEAVLEDPAHNNKEYLLNLLNSEKA